MVRIQEHRNLGLVMTRVDLENHLGKPFGGMSEGLVRTCLSCDPATPFLGIQGKCVPGQTSRNGRGACDPAAALTGISGRRESWCDCACTAWLTGHLHLDSRLGTPAAAPPCPVQPLEESGPRGGTSRHPWGGALVLPELRAHGPGSWGPEKAPSPHG